MITCQRCKKEVEPILTPKGKHLRADCPLCKKYIKFVSHIPADEFVMPFGKYKGKTIKQIFETDIDYLHWLYWEGKIGNALKKRIDDFLSKI